LTLGLLFVTANAQEEPTGASDYWPFKEGNTWTLPTKITRAEQSLTETPEKHVELVITVTKVTKIGDKTEAQLEYKADGKTFQTEIYQADAKAIVRIASGKNAAGKITPPIPVVLFPLTNGKKWDWKGTDSTKGKAPTILSKQTVSGPETLKTDAGVFKAMHVHMDQTVTVGEKQQQLINDYWFAPHVGLVQQKANVNGQDIEGTLSSYQLK